VPQTPHISLLTNVHSGSLFVADHALSMWVCFANSLICTWSVCLWMQNNDVLIHLTTLILCAQHVATRNCFTSRHQ
jgi:hypothetical protein